MKRKYSLKGRKLFKEVYSQGKKRKGKGIAVHVLTAADFENSEDMMDFVKIGITVGKKTGKAHYRNFIKRRIRAVCRDLIPLMREGSEVIISTGPAVRDMSFAELENDIYSIFRNVGLLK